MHGRPLEGKQFSGTRMMSENLCRPRHMAGQGAALQLDPGSAEMKVRSLRFELFKVIY